MKKNGVSIGQILIALVVIIICCVLGFYFGKESNNSSNKENVNNAINDNNEVVNKDNTSNENEKEEKEEKKEVSYTEPTDDFLFISDFVSTKSELKDIHSTAKIVTCFEGTVESGTFKKGDKVALLGDGVNREVLVEKIKYISDEIDSADSKQGLIQVYLTDLDSNPLTSKDIKQGQKLAKVGKYELHTEFKVKCTVDPESKYKTVNDLLNDEIHISFGHLPTAFISEDKNVVLSKDNVFTVSLEKGVAVDDKEFFYLCGKNGEINTIGKGNIVEIIK